jgi:nitrogen-specific signal transduction histidine kinase
LGLKTAVFHALSVGSFVIGISCIHYFKPSIWPDQAFSTYSLSYYAILQLLAIILVLFLLRLGRGREEELLNSLKQHKIELQRANTLKSQVFDWMNSGLIVVDTRGNISSINRKALEWIGITHDHSALGQPFGRFLPLFEQKWTQWDRQEVLRAEIADELGIKLFGATFTPLPENQGSLILFSDISRIKDLENRVQQMEKLSTIGELASGLAHEIKNPLAGIKASLQLMSQDTLPSEQKERLHRVIQRDVQRLDQLVSNFLLFAKPSQPNIEELNIHETITTCFETLQLQKQRVTLDLDASLKHLTCFWDRQHFHQVVFNILLNAVQAIDQNKFPHISVYSNKDYKGIYIAFKDNGQGIDMDKKDSLFDPFVTTKKHGTGLGLAIAQRLAVQNQAWIELNNLPSQGAEARIYISPSPSQGIKE